MNNFHVYYVVNNCLRKNYYLFFCKE